MNKLKGNLLIVAATFIWGSAFVAQSMGMETVGPFTFLAARFLVGGFVMVFPAVIIGGNRSFIKSKNLKMKQGKRPLINKGLFTAGGLCGAVLFIGAALQQVGLIYTSPGKAGFITTLYIILVPILGLFARKRVARRVWAAAAVAVAGSYLLCVGEAFSVGMGEGLVLACALFFALHIILIGRFAPLYDGILLSCIQYFTVGLIGVVFMFMFEEPRMSDILSCAAPILYTGVLSCGVAYTLQIYAQRDTDPAIAALLFSLESVFAVVSGWLILGDTLSAKELCGCALVLAAIVAAQLPASKNTRAKPHNDVT